MICVSIGRGRHKQVIAEHRHLVEEGAKLVELRLDYLTSTVGVKRLVKDRPGPVIISCRRECDGGKFDGEEEQRQMLLRTAIAEGVEYVDLEEDVAESIPRFGDTKRIVSLHDFRKTPDDLEAIHARLAQLDPDIIKICTTANHPHDNIRMMRLVKSAKIPTVGLCMGDIGVPTRILAGKCGAPFSFATFHHERALAPGQLSYQQMKDVYHYEQINAETEVYGVIADPVGHSLSPLIHNTAFHHLKLNKVYIPLRIPREDLAQFLEEAPEMGIRGLSVTIPHKEATIKSLHKVDRSVKGIGATNTVVFDGDQRLGYNTDCRAAMESLEQAVRETEDQDDSLAGKRVLILGSGGVGKAIAYGLIQRGADVVLTDGRAEVAKELAVRLKCDSTKWEMRHVIKADIIVNCTPIGMHPNVNDTPFDHKHLHDYMVVFDAVYNPENTLLIKEARERGCNVVTGVDMFVLQARLQFKLFTGQSGPAKLMRDVVKRATAAART